MVCFAHGKSCWVERCERKAFNEIFHPSAECLLTKCDAVLRVGGTSGGSDMMLRIAQERGLFVYYELHEIPSI